MKWILVIILAVIIAVFVAGWAILSSFDRDELRAQAERRFQEATGRKITLGDLSFSLGLRPSLVLSDVALANSPWGESANLAELEKIVLKLDLWPLLSRRLKINTFEISGLILALEKSGKRNNWQLRSPNQHHAASKTARKRMRGLALDITQARISLQNSHVSLRVDEVQKLDFALNAIHLTPQEDRWDIAAQTALSGQDLSLTGWLPFAVLAPTAAHRRGVAGKTPFALALRFGKSRLDLEGRGVVNTAAPQALITITDAHLEPEDLALALAQPAIFAEPLEITGMLTAARQGQGFAISAQDVVITSKDSRLNAQGRLVLGSGPAAITATLQSPLLRQRDFLKPQTQEPRQPEDGRVIPDIALNFAPLKKINADITVDIDRFEATPELTAHDIHARLRLNDGRLAITPFSAKLFDASWQGEMTADAQAQKISLTIEGTEIPVAPIAEVFKRKILLASGTAVLDFTLSGSGGDLRSLLAQSQGQLHVEVKDGTIESKALSAILKGGFALIGDQSLISRVLSLAKDDSHTLRCAIAHIPISGGVASAQTLLLDLGSWSILGGGFANLASEQLDLTFGFLGSRLGDNLGLSLRGPFADPTITPELDFSPSKLGGLVAGLAGSLVPLPGVKGGAGSVLGALGLDFSTPSGTKDTAGDRCAAARAELGATPTSNPTTTSPTPAAFSQKYAPAKQKSPAKSPAKSPGKEILKAEEILKKAPGLLRDGLRLFGQ